MSIDAVERKLCYNCGNDFTPTHLRVCKAANVLCFTCGRKGHFSKLCKQKNNKSNFRRINKREQTSEVNTRGQHQADSIRWGDAGKINSIYFDGLGVLNSDHICRINSNSSDNQQLRWTKDYLIKNEIITFKLDTGSDVNCIPLRLVKKLNIKLQNEQNRFPVFDYSGNKIKIFGTVKLKCFDIDTQVEPVTDFLVVNDSYEPLLGLGACIAFDLIKRMDVKFGCLHGCYRTRIN